MGWWSAGDNMWIEDPYQVGTATGNVAWAALALLTLGEATGQARFRAGAVRLAHWVVANANDNEGPGGFGHARTKMRENYDGRLSAHGTPQWNQRNSVDSKIETHERYCECCE